MAIALTDEDIADLAAYFSRQTPAGLEADSATYKAGEALYRGGDRARNIPSCTSCHGPAAHGGTKAGDPAFRPRTPGFPPLLLPYRSLRYITLLVCVGSVKDY